MALKRGEFERLLRSKFGFEEAENRSNDHTWYTLEIEGLPAIFTKISHSEKEFGSKLEGMIARQLRVPRPFFRDMFQCTENRQAYETRVRRDSVPPWDVHF
jgi:hypothetical protein